MILTTLALLAISAGGAMAQCAIGNLSACPSPPLNAIAAASLSLTTPLPVTSGGTGAASGATALANLGGISSSNPTVSGTFTYTNPPSGTPVSSTCFGSTGNVIAQAARGCFDITQTLYATAYGAKCNGSTNDTAALTNMFAAVTSGTLIILPPGTCTFSTAIPTINESNFTIRGAGVGVSYLEYTGANATNNIFTVGTTTSSCDQNNVNLQDFTFYSATAMTAGYGMVFNDVCFLTLRDVNVGVVNQDLYNGIWFDGGGQDHWYGGNITASNTGEVINGNTSVAFTDMYQHGGSISQGAIGINVAGNVGGINMDMIDLVNNKVNMRISQDVTAVQNRQITLGGGGMATDGTTGSPNFGIDLEDAGASGSILQINNTWISTAGATCLNIPSTIGAWEIKLTGVRMENCTTYGINDQSTSAVVLIDGGIIAGNGTGINTVANNKIRFAAWPAMQGNNANTTPFVGLSPSIGSCGTGCALAGNSTDYWGYFQMGTSGTTAVLTFNSAWLVPFCTISPFAGGGSPTVNTLSTTSVGFANLTASSDYSWNCTGLH